MTTDRKSLDQLTKEDYQRALSEIQEALAECVGDLITHYVLMAAKDIVQVACRSVKKALSYTYPMV